MSQDNLQILVTRNSKSTECVH